MNGTAFFRPMLPEDWECVVEIYRQGIERGNATFQTVVPEWNEWNSSHLESCRLIAELEKKIVGWAALSSVSTRSVYIGVAEVSVYVAPSYFNRHIGTSLLKELIRESETVGIWTLQAGIFPENKASLAIHKQLGFREVGYREKIGKMNGTWRDTILLERRSQVLAKNE